MQTTIFQELHRIFRCLHQRNRFVDKEPSTEVTLLEAHILTELAADPLQNQKSLQALFGVPQSTLSRTFARLEKRKLLKLEQTAEDKRQKRLVLTARGTKVVEETDAITDQSFVEWGKGLKKAEADAIGEFYGALADGFGHPPGNSRPGEPRHRLEQRRLTRAAGLLSDKVWGTSYSGIEWQVICEVATALAPYQSKHLGEKLSLLPATLAVITAKLEAAGLIRRSSVPSDKRVVIIEATERGLRAAEDIENQAAMQLKHALRSIGEKQVEERAAILRKFTGYRDSTLLPELPHSRLRLIPPKEDKSALREFVIHSLVRHDQARFASPILLGNENIVVVAAREEEVQIVFDGRREGDTFYLTGLGYAEAVTLKEVAEVYNRSLPAILKEACRIEFIKNEFVPLLIPKRLKN